MLEMHSPLAGQEKKDRNGLSLSEAPDFVLTQYAGDEKALKKLIGKVPKSVGHSLEYDGRTVLRMGPKQFWVLGQGMDETAGVYATPLSSGRTRFLLQGAGARNVLSTCALIDFHPSQFKPDNFVLTGIHHTPVTIHCIGADAFHIYALRTFALNVWEWLADIMEGLKDD